MEEGWGLRSAGVGVCVIMESKQGRNGLPGNTQRGGYYNTFYRIHYNYTIVFCYGVLCWTRQYTGPEHPLHYVTKTKNHYVEPSNTQEGSLQYLSILATEYCSMVYIVLCCSRQFTGGAATTIPTNHYVVLLCTRQYRKHCNTLQYSLQNTLLWCTLYYVVPGNSRTGGAATTIPAYKTHNSVCTVVYYGALLWCTMLYYVVRSNTQEGVGATSTQPLHMMLACECVHMHRLHFPAQTVFLKIWSFWIYQELLYERPYRYRGFETQEQLRILLFL